MTPREVFARMSGEWVNGGPDVWADDVVMELPFARPGHPKRTEGAAEFRKIAEAGRAALPVTFDRCEVIHTHDTTDPNTIVVEYDLHATHDVTGQQHSERFIGVLTARDGKVTRWREYQNTAAIDAVLAGQW
jgi:ketosteroid isomerase-like protein